MSVGPTIGIRYRPSLPGSELQIGNGLVLLSREYDLAVTAVYLSYLIAVEHATQFYELARVLNVFGKWGTLYFSLDDDDKADLWTMHCSFGQAVINAANQASIDERIRQSFFWFDKSVQYPVGDPVRSDSITQAANVLTQPLPPRTQSSGS